MTQSAIAGTDFSQFTSRNSPRGLFNSYIHGRRHGAAGRFAFVVFGSLIVAIFLGPWIGLLTLYCGLVGDIVDVVVLGMLEQDDYVNDPSQSQLTISTITSALQALGIAICVGIVWIAGKQDAHFFAMSFLVGTMINAGLVLRYHRPAILAKFAIYSITFLALFAVELQEHAGFTTSNYLDFFGALCLGGMLFILFAYLRRSEQKRFHFQKSLVEQHEATQTLLETLEVSEAKAQKLALIAQSATDSIFTTNEMGIITWVNPAFSSSTGYSPDEAIGKNPGEILNGPHTSQKTVDKIIAAMQAKEEVRVEIQNYRKNGSSMWIETNIKPLFDDDGAFIQFLAVERDITASKEQAVLLKKALKEAQAAADSKSQFLATMSHEIRTPMNGIIGMADLLSKTKLEDEQRTFVSTINQSGDALLQIINDILDFSKLDAGSMEIDPHAFDPKETLEAVKALMGPIAKEKGLYLSLGYKRRLPEHVMGDAGRIRQILLNLIGNAIKFTKSGGVKLVVDYTESNDVLMFDIAIIDTGIGIPADRIDSIFEQFSQAETDTSRKFGGTGLGLSISQLLTQKMGGEIKVESTLGQGSTFRVSLNLGKVIGPVKEEAPKTKQSDVSFLAGKQVLIAEDNKTNRLLISKMMAPTKAIVEFAHDGLEVVEKRFALNPELILMDISMPEQDGRAATREIRAKETNGTRVPIVALTANAFKEDEEACKDAGMDGFLSKPIRKNKLNAELARVWAEFHE